MHRGGAQNLRAVFLGRFYRIHRAARFPRRSWAQLSFTSLQSATSQRQKNVAILAGLDFALPDAG